ADRRHLLLVPNVYAKRGENGGDWCGSVWSASG
ncbi:MAG: hypothetical protein ACI9HE_003648, partial [Planctomycetota bacterium]